MSTKTQTTTTHYHIQKKRRAEFIDEWRKYRQTVIRKEDVTLVPTARGLRTGVYMGWDGDRPTRCLDALVHEDDAVDEPFQNLPPRPKVSRGMPGNDPYARRLRRIDQETKKRRSGRIHTPYDEQEILATPRGTRTKFLNDRSIGNQASGLTQVM